MVNAKFILSASLTILTVATYAGATALPNQVSSDPAGQLLTARGIGSGITDKPLDKRGLHMRRAVFKDLALGADRLSKDSTLQTSMITELQKKSLPKVLIKAQAFEVNGKIEQILSIDNDAKDFCKKIAAAYPDSQVAKAAMQEVDTKGRAFGTFMAQSKRGVGGDGTELKGNMEKAQLAFQPLAN
ncbi:hypothetical protein PTTG_30349, partial [Puccinia triticina 1-1 BBBD Race 1]